MLKKSIFQSKTTEVVNTLKKIMSTVSQSSIEAVENMRSKCYLILKRSFNHNSFRENQLKIILNTLNGNDVIAVMATGSGKSLCYQLPAIYSNKSCFVISPLLSLIQNQITYLKSNGISAISITSDTILTSTDYKDIFAYNKYALIYLTPERLPSLLSQIKYIYNNHGISLFVIDEAHLVSEWGHDFRPSYQDLYVLREQFPKIPIMALTATSTTVRINEIIRSLKLGQGQHNLCKVKSTFHRRNLSYFLKEKQSIEADLCWRRNKEYYCNGSTIIYCITRNDTEEIAKKLQVHGINANAYHAGMENEERREIQNKWENDEIQCIVATSSFGMGIDKGNIRFVIHYGMTMSLESYYQQTGRAGRDGLQSKCILFWTKAEFEKNEWIQQSFCDSIKREKFYQKQTQIMRQFTFSKECRVKWILNYFGENTEKCGNRCDNCLKMRNESKHYEFSRASKLRLNPIRNSNSMKWSRNKMNQKRKRNFFEILNEKAKIDDDDKKEDDQNPMKKRKIDLKIKKLATRKLKLFREKITTQSRQIFKAFEYGESMEEIRKERLCKIETIEKSLYQNIMNGEEIDWNRLSFNKQHYDSCFMAINENGFKFNGYDEIRKYDMKTLGNLRNTEIDLLVARYWRIQKETEMAQKPTINYELNFFAMLNSK